MEEITKKRSRKTKLIPREYLDSDDENIAQMQNEIEEAIAQMNPLSILRKLEPKQPQKDIEFSVKIEVEEVDHNVTEELKHTEDSQDLDFNIKIHSVKSLSEPTQDAPNMSDDIQFIIDEDEIREDFESLSQETTSLADKIIEIYLRNTFGKKQFLIAQSHLDKRLQNILRKWRSWYKFNPQHRDAPLMYICYACFRGWWNFSEFREHLNHSHKRICLNIDTRNYQAILIATKGSNGRGVANCPDILPCTFDSNCWKCNKDRLIHLRSQYVCDGCNNDFRTCTALSFHEGECEMYRKKIILIKGMNVEKDVVISYRCPVCSYKDWDEERLRTHIMNVHRVRSDLPIDWSIRECTKCNLHYHEPVGHRCPERKVMESCAFCKANFQSLEGLINHVHNLVNDYKCKLCNKILRKSCMEPEHMLEHTNNYMQLIKCSFCPEPTYFLNEKTAKHHKRSVHGCGKKIPYYKVIIPKRLFDRLQPIKYKPLQEKSNDLNQIVPEPAITVDARDDLNRINNHHINGQDPQRAVAPLIVNNHHAQFVKYCQELRDTQDPPEVTPHAPQTRRLFDPELGVEITIINKSVVRELSDAIVADIKAKELNREQSKIVKKPVMNVKVPVNKTYVNEKKSNTDNSADNTEVKADEIEVKNEIDIENIKVKEEIMDTDELDMNIEVKNEVDDGVTNFVDIEIKSEIVGEVRAIESCEDEIKQEPEDFIDYEHDIISWGDLNSADGTEDAEKDTCFEDTCKDFRKERKSNVSIFAAKYKCTKCNKGWRTLNKYLLHFVNHNYKPETCPQCLKYCHGSLTSHVSSHVKRLFVLTHSIEHWKVRSRTSYRCKKCKEVLGSKEFFRHWESHLNISGNTVLEQQCPVDMTEKPHLIEIMERLQGHENGESWKHRYCQVCNKKFDRTNDCKRHYIEHLLTDAYQEKQNYGALLCQICGTGFQKKEYYKRHMRDHASLPVYICEICDKTFSDSSNFCKHKKVHNLAVLICDICKKKFNNKRFLIKHIELHELIKPINCKTCDKVFYTPSSYKKHLKINRARFKCVICNKIYHSLKDKWDHMWQVHKERKYEADCPVCDKSFRKFQEVKQHLRSEHAEHKYVFQKPIQKNKKASWRRVNTDDYDVDVVT